MTTEDISHTLQDRDQIDAIVRRLKRAHGQIGAVVRMLDDGPRARRSSPRWRP